MMTKKKIQSESGIFLPSENVGDGWISQCGIAANLSWALRSHRGVIRSENEDFVGAHAPKFAGECGPLFVVADGMGGHAAGEVASRIAVETLLESWTNNQKGQVHQTLRAAVRTANTEVFSASLDRACRGMGTTLTALALAGNQACIGHVGDSRAYLVRDNKCLQMTSDHSRVAEMLRMRLITPEQAAKHPARSQLTRSLGATPGVQVDVERTNIVPGDTFVLCSDGLWDLISRQEIAEATNTADVDETAKILLKSALERGAPDNVTVIAVRITSELPVSPYQSKRRFFFFCK